MVEMGHTHYNELQATAAGTVYATTRSTGCDRRGFSGFSVTTLDDKVAAGNSSPSKNGRS